MLSHHFHAGVNHTVNNDGDTRCTTAALSIGAIYGGFRIVGGQAFDQGINQQFPIEEGLQ